VPAERGVRAARGRPGPEFCVLFEWQGNEADAAQGRAAQGNNAVVVEKAYEPYAGGVGEYEQGADIFQKAIVIRCRRTRRGQENRV